MSNIEANNLKKTVLWGEHKSLGARLVPFGGFDMPVQYSGLIDEHQSVRSAAGLFDVSHMGALKVSGPNAFSFLNHSLTRDLSKVEVGQAAYSLLCLESGGTVDDLICYRVGAEEFLLVLNASNKDKDFQYLKSLASPATSPVFESLFESHTILALQGPKVPEFFSSIAALKEWPKNFTITRAKLWGEINAWVGFTGYTGELGCEIIFESSKAIPVWRRLLKEGQSVGLKPIGLGARDSLRTEMGYSLYGHELSDSINPIEAGLGWAVGLKKDAFVGLKALQDAKAQPQRKLVCLKNAGRQAPRADFRVFDGRDQDCGTVTSGTFAPSLDHVIGMALVAHNSIGPYKVEIRGQKIPFEECQRPFLNRPKN
jgi:aminomethyltransferase